MEEELYEAVEENKIDDVRRILRENPNIDVNWGNGRWTILFVGCKEGHVECVRELLRHPKIDVNFTQDWYKWTPIYSAVYNDNLEVVSELLKAPGVDLELPKGRTPLMLACYENKIEAMQIILGSGKKIDLDEKESGSGETVYESAKKWGKGMVLRILDEYLTNPTLFVVKHKNPLITVRFYCLLKLVSMGFLKSKGKMNDLKIFKTHRFFSVASTLPPEIQMIISNMACCTKWDLFVGEMSPELILYYCKPDE